MTIWSNVAKIQYIGGTSYNPRPSLTIPLEKGGRNLHTFGTIGLKMIEILLA